MIHLDTNVVIALLNNRPPVVRARFDAALADRRGMAISGIVYFELRFGAAASQQRQRNEEKLALLLAAGGIAILPFDHEDARLAGEIRALLKQGGTPVGPYDVLIAAQARRHGAELVTANQSEFRRIPGLKLADWSV